MKKIMLLLAFFFLLLSGTAFQTIAATTNDSGDASADSNIAARVDNDIISKAEVEFYATNILNLSSSKAAGVEISPQEWKSAVNFLVDVQLQANSAHRLGLELSDREKKNLSHYLAAFKARFPHLSEDFIKEMLLNDSFAARAREEAFLNIPISREELVSYYEENPDEFERPEQAHIASLKTADHATYLQFMEKAKASGADFAALAKELPTVDSNEIMDQTVSLNRYDTSPFSKLLFSLEPGEVGAIEDQDSGSYRIVKVLEKTPAGKISLDAAYEKLATFLRRKKAPRVLDAWLKDLRAKADVEIY